MLASYILEHLLQLTAILEYYIHDIGSCMNNYHHEVSLNNQTNQRKILKFMASKSAYSYHFNPRI